MPIEIRELVIRATIDRKKNSSEATIFSESDKKKLKQEVLAFCIQELKKPLTLNTPKIINR